MSKYQGIADTLREDISRGVYTQGQLLPTEEQLCAKFGASRQTVRQALSLLVESGLITKQRGSGSRINPRAENPRSGNIAVITTYISDYIFPGILREADAVFSAAKYTAILAATRNSVYNERSILLELLNKPIDGILVEGTKTALPNPNLDLYRKFREKNIPLVFFNGYYSELEGCVAVYADNYGGGYELVSYLLSKGRERIAGIFKNDDIQGHQRYFGYISALRDNNKLMPGNSVFWYATENRDEFVSAELAEKLSEFDAVVCYNDEIAFRLIPLLLDRSRRVGRDIAVLSFDDSSLSEISPVKISSLSYGEKNIGRTAAEKLIRLIGGEKIDSETLPWLFKERDSSR